MKSRWKLQSSFSIVEKVLWGEWLSLWMFWVWCTDMQRKQTVGSRKCAEGRRHRHGWDGKAAEVSLSQTGAEMDSGGWGPSHLMEPGHVALGRPRQRKPGWKRRKWRWDKVGSSTPGGPRSAGLQSGRFGRWGPTDVFHSEQLRVLSVPLLQQQVFLRTRECRLFSGKLVPL